MIKFALSIAAAVILANMLANTINIEPVAGSNLDRAQTITQIAGK